MSHAMNIALSGMAASLTKLDVTANNTANMNTNGFKKSRADMNAAYPDGVRVTLSSVDTPGTPLPVENGQTAPAESSNVSLEEEMIGLMQSQQTYEPNLKVVQMQDDLLGELIDLKA